MASPKKLVVDNNNEKIKNHSLKVVATEEDLAFMRKYREKFVQQMRQDKYDHLEMQLEDHISDRKQPQSALNSEA